MSKRTFVLVSLILILLAVVYANAVENAIRDAHGNAAIRMIGEAIADNDIAAVRRAIDAYHLRGESASVIIEVLSDREGL